MERRLARAISRLGSQLGRGVPDGVLIDTPLSRQDLAEMTGTTLYTVSRILNEWQRHNIVRAGREQVVITDAHALTTIGEDLPHRGEPPSPTA